jgi:glycosyltransferase A (GT-A) superfamily protein (DUF2064 family)
MHLTVIAKEPRPGFAKTRLCPPCTPDEAASIAAAALADTLDAIDALAAGTHGDVARVLLFDGDARAWARPGWQVVVQRGGSLDERLANGFDDLGRGVIVGMETPHAVASLGGALDAIGAGRDGIGLATDGGYWAIALASVDRRMFDDVPMSTSHTGLAQLRRLYAHGRAVQRLPFARDLDTFADVVDAAERTLATPMLRDIARTVVARVRDERTRSS